MTTSLEAAKADLLLMLLSLYYSLHSWMPCLDAGGSVRTVFVDFRTAFDLVNHTIRFNKLQE